MHPFALFLIGLLSGGILVALVLRAEIARARESGYLVGFSAAEFAQAKKDSARARKAAQTRRSKS
jgi:hypothetical protein